MARKKRQQPASEQAALIQALLGPGVGGKPLSPEQMIENLQVQGYRIVKDDPAQARRTITRIRETSAKRFSGGKTLAIGVVSDTHLGSRQQQITHLNTFYDRCVQRGITAIFHAGDLVDGDGRVYPGQMYDLFQYGYSKQLEYAAERYPIREGITTYVVAGNHDWSYYRRGGANVLQELAERRRDIHYLGPSAAQVVIDGIKIQLTHGKGGQTYARSYRIQRLIENFTPEQKPEIFLLGNFHNWAPVPMVRNVIGWQLGCFQAQTEHEKALGLFPEIGGLILEVDFGTEGADRPNGIVVIRDELIPFYKPIENDF